MKKNKAQTLKQSTQRFYSKLYLEFLTVMQQLGHSWYHGMIISMQIQIKLVITRPISKLTNSSPEWEIVQSLDSLVEFDGGLIASTYR